MTKQTKEVEMTLALCPFCGRTPELLVSPLRYGRERWYVGCKPNCCSMAGASGKPQTVEQAIEKWNRRTE